MTTQIELRQIVHQHLHKEPVMLPMHL